MDSIKIADGQDKTRQKDAISNIMSEALGTCFDETEVIYIQTQMKAYDFYHKKKTKSHSILNTNKITKVATSKTFNVALVGTGGSLYLACHVASSRLMQEEILYITLEWQKRKIAERIDSNSSTSRSNS